MLTSVSFRTSRLWVGFKNAVLYSIIFTIVSVAVTMLAAYPMSLPDFKGKKFFNTLFVITMFFSGGLIHHLPAHQQSGSAGFHVGGHSAGSIQRVEHDHCPYLLSRHPA